MLQDVLGTCPIGGPLLQAWWADQQAHAATGGAPLVLNPGASATSLQLATQAVAGHVSAMAEAGGLTQATEIALPAQLTGAAGAAPLVPALLVLMPWCPTHAHHVQPGSAVRQAVGPAAHNLTFVANWVAAGDHPKPGARRAQFFSPAAGCSLAALTGLDPTAADAHGVVQLPGAAEAWQQQGVAGPPPFFLMDMATANTATGAAYDGAAPNAKPSDEQQVEQAAGAGAPLLQLVAHHTAQGLPALMTGADLPGLAFGGAAVTSISQPGAPPVWVHVQHAPGWQAAHMLLPPTGAGGAVLQALQQHGVGGFAAAGGGGGGVGTPANLLGDTWAGIYVLAGPAGQFGLVLAGHHLSAQQAAMMTHGDAGTPGLQPISTTALLPWYLLGALHHAEPLPDLDSEAVTGHFVEIVHDLRSRGGQTSGALNVATRRPLLSTFMAPGLPVPYALADPAAANEAIAQGVRGKGRGRACPARSSPAAAAPWAAQVAAGRRPDSG